MALLCDLNAGHFPLDLRMESLKGESATKKKRVWACLTLKSQGYELAGIYPSCLGFSLEFALKSGSLRQLGCSGAGDGILQLKQAWLLRGAERSDSVLCS